MKRVLIVLVVLAVLFGVFIAVVPRLLGSPSQTTKPAAPAPAPAVAQAPSPPPAGEQAAPKISAAGPYRGLERAFEAGNIPAAWRALDVLHHTDVSVLSASQQARTREIAGILTPASAHYTAAEHGLEIGRKARGNGHLEDARKTLKQAAEELKAITGVPNFHWSETPLGKEIQSQLDALSTAASDEAAWQSRVNAALRVRQNGSTEEALAAFRSLLDHAPANRKAWVARQLRELERLRDLEAKSRNLSNASLDDVEAMLKAGQYPQSLAALNVLQEKSKSGAEIQRIAQLKKATEKLMQQRQAALQKQTVEVKRLTDLARNQLANKQLDQAKETLTRASDLVGQLKQVRRKEPGYQLDVNGLDRAVSELSRKIDEAEANSGP